MKFRLLFVTTCNIAGVKFDVTSGMSALVSSSRRNLAAAATDTADKLKFVVAFEALPAFELNPK